jgi:hypothetical protein
VKILYASFLARFLTMAASVFERLAWQPTVIDGQLDRVEDDDGAALCRRCPPALRPREVA